MRTTPQTEQITELSEAELQAMSTAEIRLLRSLPMEERYELLKTSTHRHFTRGSVLFREGDKVDALYVITKGTVKLANYDADGREQIVGIFGQYDTIWEGVYLKESFYSYSGICVTDVSVCIIYKSRFEKILRDPDVAIRTIGFLSQKLHDANERNKILSAGSPRQKMAGFLLYWVEHHRKETMQLKLSDIAASTGMRPETASRSIKSFEREGLLQRVGQSGIKILAYERLKEIYEV